MMAFILDRMYQNPRKTKQKELLVEASDSLRTKAYDHMVQTFADLVEWCQKNHIALVTLPTGDSDYYSDLKERFTPEGVRFVDYDTLFAKADIEQIHLKEGHWNAYGHSIVAEQLYALLTPKKN